MRRTVRGVLAAAVAAAGLVLVPGAPGAQAVGPWVCTATGTVERVGNPSVPNYPVSWRVTAEGTCTSGAAAYPVHISGGSGSYFPPYLPDYPCGSPQRAVESPGNLFVDITGPPTTLRQVWQFPSNSRAFAVYSVGYTPHAYPDKVIGAGSAANRIFLQCPGVPTAKFDFAFAA